MRLPRVPRQAATTSTTTSWREKFRPRGARFSFVGSILLLFTGTLAFLMFRFPMFHGIKVSFGVMALFNALFFVRFGDPRRKSLYDRMMASKFFPRKLTFTNEGKFLVLISLGMGFAAVNTGSNLLYLLLGMLMSVIMASGFLSELSVRDVAWTADFPGQAVAGVETLFPVRVTNRKKRLNSFSLEVLLQFAGDPELKQTKGAVLKLEPGQSDPIFPRITFPCRGRFEVAGLSLGTSYPFSFFHKSRNFQVKRDVVVLPRGDRDVASLVFSLATGHEENANVVGRGSEFFSVRPMQPGDEWRSVHWKQSAKHGAFAVKEFEAMTARRAYVELVREESGARREERWEEGVELAASIVRRLAETGYEVGLRTETKRVRPAAGSGAVHEVFLALALLDLSQLQGTSLSLADDDARARDIVIRVELDTLAVSVTGGRR
jgi:uncharacterized protein (DUF58 family)